MNKSILFMGAFLMLQCDHDRLTIPDEKPRTLNWIGRPLEEYCEPDPSTDTVICDAEAFHSGLLGCIDLYEQAKLWKLEAETNKKLATVDAASWAELLRICEEKNEEIRYQNLIWGTSGALIMGVLTVLVAILA